MVTGPLATAPAPAADTFSVVGREMRVSCGWADVTTGEFLIVWGVGALQNNKINDVLWRYYSIQYLNISIIHLPCPQSLCPLRCCPAAGQLVSARPSFPSYKYSELQPPVLATLANTTPRPSGKSSSRKSLVSSLSSGQSAHTVPPPQHHFCLCLYYTTTIDYR